MRELVNRMYIKNTYTSLCIGILYVELVLSAYNIYLTLLNIQEVTHPHNIHIRYLPPSWYTVINLCSQFMHLSPSS